MKNATHNRISYLLPLVTLVGLALTASAVSAGVNTWTTSGPGGGNIRELAIDPVNPATLYAAAESGGLFKSTNGGGSWRAINTGLTEFRRPGPRDRSFRTLHALRRHDRRRLQEHQRRGELDAERPDLSQSLAHWRSIRLLPPPSTPGPVERVFKSVDGGVSWTHISSPPTV